MPNSAPSTSPATPAMVTGTTRSRPAPDGSSDLVIYGRVLTDLDRTTSRSRLPIPPVRLPGVRGRKWHVQEHDTMITQAQIRKPDARGTRVLNAGCDVGSHANWWLADRSADCLSRSARKDGSTTPSR